MQLTVVSYLFIIIIYWQHSNRTSFNAELSTTTPFTMLMSARLFIATGWQLISNCILSTSLRSLTGLNAANASLGEAVVNGIVAPVAVAISHTRQHVRVAASELDADDDDQFII